MAQSPCPNRIIDDMGYAFCMGSIGGSVWHGVKGYRNAPRGVRNRFYGSFKSIASRAPVLGGNFAVWGLCFSSFDCTYLHMRRKDDPLNAIAAGASTGAVLAWRAGMSSMLRSAAIGGVFLAVIEGLGLMLQKAFAGPQQGQQGPISPYSTYQPAGPNRHVGDLADPNAEPQETISTNIAGADNSISWDLNNESASDLDFTFDSFGENNSNDIDNQFGDFNSGNDSGITFGNNDR